MNDPNAIARDMHRFYDEPYGFVMYAYDWGKGELSGFDGPDDWQREFLYEIGERVRQRGFDGKNAVSPIRMATASGHGIGKSALTAWLVDWIMSTRPYAKGVVTANTSPQLETKTWAEIAKWTKRCVTRDWFHVATGKGSMKMVMRHHPESWRCDAQTCREENSEAFAGLHAATSTPFYIFDEGSAVPDAIYEVAEGGMTDGEPMFFVFGNPTRNSGKFFECFNRLKHRWSTRQIDSRTVKITNKQQIAQWEEDYGEDSDFFRVRVRGVFPRQGDMQFFASDIVRAAMTREAACHLHDPLTLGVDIARGGEDESVLYPVKGLDARTHAMRRLRTRDTMKIVSAVIAMHEEHSFDAIFVDATGIGAGVYDRLFQLGLPVIEIQFGAASPDRKYANMRAFIAARLRDKLKLGMALPDDPELEAQLTGIEYGHNRQDQLQLERKEDMKKRGLSSPDIADALALSVAMPVETSIASGGRHATGDLHQSSRYQRHT